MSSEDKSLSAVWKGSKGLIESANSPVYTGDGTNRLCTRVYKGPFKTALASAPTIGQTMEEIESTFLVQSWKVEPSTGGKGSLTVVLRAAPQNETGDTGEVASTIEIDWTQIQKKIETHKLFSTLDSTTVALVNDALNANDQPTRDRIWQKISAGGGDQALAQKLYDKKLKGRDSYVIYVPVVKRVTTYNGRPPVSSAAGRISVPPEGPSSYKYMMTADRLISINNSKIRWERHEEWTGADEIDTDLYD